MHKEACSPQRAGNVPPSITRAMYASNLFSFQGEDAVCRSQTLRIDKTLLIAEPMGRVSWTECFAAGEGSVGGWVQRGCRVRLLSIGWYSDSPINGDPLQAIQGTVP